MNFDDRAIQRYRFDPDANNLRALQLREHTVEHAVAGPAIHACIDGVPTAKPRGQATPFAPVLGDIEDRVEHLQV